MSTPTLTTARLTLRPVTLHDAPAIQKHFAHWNIIRNLSTRVPWPYPDDGAADFITNIVLPAEESGSSLTWALTEQGADELIGVIDFTFEDTGLGNRGFWLAEPFWGRGYMTEAVEALQDYVLLELGIERMVVLNSVANPASRRIKEKTGARLLGQVQVTHRNGETASDKWEITRSAWAKRRNRDLGS